MNIKSEFNYRKGDIIEYNGPMGNWIVGKIMEFKYGFDKDSNRFYKADIKVIKSNCLDKNDKRVWIKCDEFLSIYKDTNTIVNEFMDSLDKLKF